MLASSDLLQKWSTSRGVTDPKQEDKTMILEKHQEVRHFCYTASTVSCGKALYSHLPLKVLHKCAQSKQF